VSRPPPLREAVEIPGRGRLEVRVDEDRVVFVSNRGEARCFDAHPIVSEPGRLTRIAARDGRSALIARHTSDRLYHFDAGRLTLRSVQGFERLRRSEELSLHGIESGYLVISENGVAALDHSGQERWRIEEVTCGWRLEADAQDILWLRDTAGNVVGIDARTGREVAG